MSTNLKDQVKKILTKAHIEVNGKHPWDIKIYDERFYQRVARDKDLGLGESYMDGWWDCEKIDEMIARLLKITTDNHFKPSLQLIWEDFRGRLFNLQNKKSSKEVAEKHYNIGNHLYQAMLDKSMNYSCGYWKNAENLEEAQQEKMDLVCRKLMLKPGLRLLDIGCGWGGLAKYAAEKYQVEVTGITISLQQKEYADKICKGLLINIQLMDYRDISAESYDRVVSIGMFEHVGYKNYRTFMRKVHQALSEDGIFLLHTIGGNSSYNSGAAWLNKYIFPNGMLPSVLQIGTAIENLFVMEDWHNFGVDYDKTLRAWYENFIAHWPLLEKNFNERFFRMWKFYLLSCAACFRVRKIQLWQIVLTKNGLQNGFQNRL